MFKNIGKTIRVLAIVLAILCFLGFAALGTLSLLATMEKGISKDLKTAGLQAAIICYVFSILAPALTLVMYGFGKMISDTQETAEETKKIKEMLQTALSDGMLSEEIGRKVGQVQAKVIAQLMAQTPAPAAPKNTRAPMQRPVEEIPQAPATPQPQVAPQAPAVPVVTINVPVEEAPCAEQAPAEESISVKEEAPLTPAPAFIPVKPITTTPVTPTAGATLLRPLSGDEETF